jgi:hypothetical protein
MTDLAPFPDVEDVLAVLVADLGATGSYVPANLKDQLPFHHLYRFGGRDDRISDSAIVAIDTFAGTRAIALQRAEQVRQRLLAAPHAVITGAGTVVVDYARTGDGPHEKPWGDSTVRRMTATYTVTLRRPVSP